MPLGPHILPDVKEKEGAAAPGSSFAFIPPALSQKRRWNSSASASSTSSGRYADADQTPRPAPAAPLSSNLYAYHFEVALAKDTQQREISFYMKSAMAKLASPLSAGRSEGLKDALEALVQLSNSAAMETRTPVASSSATAPQPSPPTALDEKHSVRSASQHGKGGDGSANSPGVPQQQHGASTGHSPLPTSPRAVMEEDRAFVPYNALQVEACASYITSGGPMFRVVAPPGGKHGAGGSSGAGLDSAPVEAGGGSPRVGSSVGVNAPPITSRAENGAELVSGPSPPKRSPTWDLLQRALESGDYTSAVFHHILVPRQDTRVRMNMGMGVDVKLSAVEALRWTTLPPSARPSSSSSPAPLFHQLTAVRYEEQELALRLIQGLALCAYHQRRCLADGCLFHYAAEVLQCFVQHVEALHQEQQLKQLRRQRHHKKRRSSSSRRKRHPLEDDDEEEGGELPNAALQLDEGLSRIILALIQVVEAACHYNPPCMTRLVQAGGVKALLDVVYLPAVPVAIRATVLDAMSVLLQEVTPFRRAVAAASANIHYNAASTALPNGVPPNPCIDSELLPWMVQQAMSGGNHTAYRSPYLMDRASASKFDSAVREWFSRNGLSHLVSAVLDLRRDDAPPITSKATLMKAVQRANQRREQKLTALLQAIDGQRTDLR